MHFAKLIFKKKLFIIMMLFRILILVMMIKKFKLGRKVNIKNHRI